MWENGENQAISEFYLPIKEQISDYTYLPYGENPYAAFSVTK